MSTDDLDSLDDAALSEAFACECAGWRKITWRRREIWDAHGIPYTKPDFATSADAVLPHAGHHWDSHQTPDGVHFCVRNVLGEVLGAANSSTLPRSICIALLRWKRAEKGQP
jgi:hypothetical protein